MLKLADVRSKAKQLGMTDLPAERTELIRRIQVYEGFSPCFRTKSTCEYKKCCWYEECLKK